MLTELLNSKDKIIKIEAGIYCIDKKIVLENIQGKIFVFDKNALICGSKTINVNWSSYNDNILVCQIEKNLEIDGLIINGKLKIMARYPNYSEDLPLGGTVPLQKFKHYSHPETGYVRGLHEFAWGGNSYKIKSQDSKGNLILEWIGDNNRGNKTREVVVENIFEELDCPEEWFYDSLSGKLYYYPLKNENNIEQITLLINDEIFELKNCSDIVFSGLNIANTARCMFRHNYEPLLRGDWAIQRNGAIHLVNCKNITFEKGTANCILGNVFVIDGYNENISINSFDICNTGASGIVIAGNTDAARDYSTWQNHKTKISDLTEGPKSNNYPRNVFITNNHMYNLGMFEKQSAGVCISISKNIYIENNTIHHVPRACININDGTFGGHKIHANLLYDAVRETSDHGEFNSWGRDRFWSYKGYGTSGKKGKQKSKYVFLDAVSTTEISYNFLYSQKGFGIDLDDGSSNYSIFNNVCIGSGIKLREGFKRNVYGNILFNSQIDLHCSYAHNNDVISNNVFVAHMPFFTYNINKGSDTSVFDNEYINCTPPSFDISPKIRIENNPLSKSFFDKIVCEKIGFAKFGADFGEKPEILFRTCASKDSTSFVFDHITFETLNDSTKSSYGVDGGLIVAKISLYKRLVYGIKKNDVLYQFDKDKVNTQNIDGLLTANIVTVYRNQKPYSLKKRNFLQCKK